MIALLSRLETDFSAVLQAQVRAFEAQITAVEAEEHKVEVSPECCIVEMLQNDREHKWSHLSPISVVVTAIPRLAHTPPQSDAVRVLQTAWTRYQAEVLKRHAYQERIRVQPDYMHRVFESLTFETAFSHAIWERDCQGLTYHPDLAVLHNIRLVFLYPADSPLYPTPAPRRKKARTTTTSETDKHRDERKQLDQMKQALTRHTQTWQQLTAWCEAQRIAHTGCNKARQAHKSTTETLGSVKRMLERIILDPLNFSIPASGEYEIVCHSVLHNLLTNWRDDIEADVHKNASMLRKIEDMIQQSMRKVARLDELIAAQCGVYRQRTKFKAQSAALAVQTEMFGQLDGMLRQIRKHTDVPEEVVMLRTMMHDTHTHQQTTEGAHAMLTSTSDDIAKLDALFQEQNVRVDKQCAITDMVAYIEPLVDAMRSMEGRIPDTSKRQEQMLQLLDKRIARIEKCKQDKTPVLEECYRVADKRRHARLDATTTEVKDKMSGLYETLHKTVDSAFIAKLTSLQSMIQQRITSATTQKDPGLAVMWPDAPLFKQHTASETELNKLAGTVADVQLKAIEGLNAIENDITETETNLLRTWLSDSKTAVEAAEYRSCPQIWKGVAGLASAIAYLYTTTS